MLPAALALMLKVDAARTVAAMALSKLKCIFYSVYVPCEVCGGKRYNRETLEVRYKGRTLPMCWPCLLKKPYTLPVSPDRT